MNLKLGPGTSLGDSRGAWLLAELLRFLCARNALVDIDCVTGGSVVAALSHFDGQRLYYQSLGERTSEACSPLLALHLTEIVGVRAASVPDQAAIG